MHNMPQILLVDDDAALLQALPQALSLRVNNIQVDTCDSAFEALEQIQDHDYDAIVSDIKMPGMDGLALLEKIQELRPETPTLLITGHGEHNLAIQALRGGAYDFIQKPIDREYVVAALRKGYSNAPVTTSSKRTPTCPGTTCPIARARSAESNARAYCKPMRRKISFSAWSHMNSGHRLLV